MYMHFWVSFDDPFLWNVIYNLDFILNKSSTTLDIHLDICNDCRNTEASQESENSHGDTADVEKLI